MRRLWKKMRAEASDGQFEASVGEDKQLFWIRRIGHCALSTFSTDEYILTINDIDLNILYRESQT